MAQTDDTPNLVVVDDESEIVTRAKRLAEARSAASRWKQVADHERDEILTALEEEGGPDVLGAVTASGVRVVGITETTSKRFDVNKFREDHPDMDLSKYFKPTYSRQVRPGSM